MHNNSNMQNQQMEISTCKILPLFKISPEKWPLFLDVVNSSLPWVKQLTLLLEITSDVAIFKSKSKLYILETQSTKKKSMVAFLAILFHTLLLYTHVTYDARPVCMSLIMLDHVYVGAWLLSTKSQNGDVFRLVSEFILRSLLKPSVKQLEQHQLHLYCLLRCGFY